MDEQDINLLEILATIVIDSSKGTLENNIKDIEEEYFEKNKILEEEHQLLLEEENTNDIDILENNKELKYYNEYGAFSPDGKEYLIKVNKQNRLPTVWSHILTNQNFGTVVTENLGGYTWYKNSRLNRVSSWQNNPSYDIPSEIIYLKDMETKKTWSLGLNPMPDNNNYNIIYGFGYCKYIHKSDGIEQELEIFVPTEDSCKVGILNLKNITPNRKKIKLYYYIKPVLGEDEIKTNGYICTNFDKNNNIIYSKSIYNTEDKSSIAYISSSEKIISYTGSKKSFLGSGKIENPIGIKKEKLNNETGLGQESCMALEINIELESYANKEVIIMLGANDNLIDCKNTAYKYSKLSNVKQELLKTKNYWKEILGRLQVYTPLESTNILLNGWIPYQTIASRLYARSGYYQSGGAYGFRDQLQDTLGVRYLEPEFMKNQIIKHSEHQFLEGDVEHWWHEETGRGIRTKFSDDLLWLVYLTIKYIEFTGDNSILDIETKYLSGEILQEGQDEKYDLFKQSDVSESIYEHCIRAIEKSLNFGEHGYLK